MLQQSAPFLIGAQMVVGLLFAVAAIRKALHPIAFARAIAGYSILPARMSFVTGVILIVIEALVGISHLTGRSVSTTAWLGLALCLVFTAATGKVLKDGRLIRCRCFGGFGKENVSISSIWRLVALAVGEMIVVVARSSGGPLELSKDLRAVTMLWIPAVTGVFLLGMWVSVLPDISQLFTGGPKKGRGAAVRIIRT